MVDTVSTEIRSRIMAAVRSTHTMPERRVRSIAHRMGYRFRLQRRDLPGTPDIVFPRHRVCILVHGCFWHRHPGCKFATLPKTRTEYWRSKFDRNVERDRKNITELKTLNWKVEVIWECETRDAHTIAGRLNEILA